MMKRLKIRGYVEIPANMSANEFCDEINGVPMFFNDHDLDTFKLHLEEEEPAADVVEVKHGKWFRHNKKKHGDTCYYCSVCEKMAIADGYCWELTDYCPHCGAKMDEERSENDG